MLPYRYQDVVRDPGGALPPRFRAKERPPHDRYTWGEGRVLVSPLGTVVMIGTGFMLWNPIATARFLPGEFIPPRSACTVARPSWPSGRARLALPLGAPPQLQPGDVHRPADRARDGARAPARAGADQGRGGDARSRPRGPRRRQKVFLPVAGPSPILLLVGSSGSSRSSRRRSPRPLVPVSPTRPTLARVGLSGSLVRRGRSLPAPGIVLEDPVEGSPTGGNPSPAPGISDTQTPSRRRSRGR